MKHGSKLILIIALFLAPSLWMNPAVADPKPELTPIQKYFQQFYPSEAELGTFSKCVKEPSMRPGVAYKIPGLLTPQQQMALQLAHSREFAFFFHESRGYFIKPGTEHGIAEFPQFLRQPGSTWISHTHPPGYNSQSPADMMSMQRMKNGQKISKIYFVNEFRGEFQLMELEFTGKGRLECEGIGEWQRGAESGAKSKCPNPNARVCPNTPSPKGAVLTAFVHAAPFIALDIYASLSHGSDSNSPLACLTGNGVYSSNSSVPGTKPGSVPGTLRCNIPNCPCGGHQDLPYGLVDNLYRNRKYKPNTGRKVRCPDGPNGTNWGDRGAFGNYFQCQPDTFPVAFNRCASGAVFFNWRNRD